jgi:putative tricarboxylic transport membrane protein
VRRVNIALALIFLALSAVVVAGVRDLAYWSDFAPGPAFAPVWLAAVGAVLALLLILQEVRNPSGAPADLPPRPALTRVALTMTALALVLLAAPQLGFVAAVAALALFVLLVVERRRILPSLIVTVLTAALVHGVFIAWLNVQLPKGFLGL